MSDHRRNRPPKSTISSTESTIYGCYMERIVEVIVYIYSLMV